MVAFRLSAYVPKKCLIYFIRSARPYAQWQSCSQTTSIDALNFSAPSSKVTDRTQVTRAACCSLLQCCQVNVTPLTSLWHRLGLATYGSVLTTGIKLAFNQRPSQSAARELTSCLLPDTTRSLTPHSISVPLCFFVLLLDQHLFMSAFRIQFL
jgi:hypothetical protein